jgi:hypothetical protein
LPCDVFFGARQNPHTIKLAGRRSGLFADNLMERVVFSVLFGHPTDNGSFGWKPWGYAAPKVKPMVSPEGPGGMSSSTLCSINFTSARIQICRRLSRARQQISYLNVVIVLFEVKTVFDSYF